MKYYILFVFLLFCGVGYCEHLDKTSTHNHPLAKSLSGFLGGRKGTKSIR